jgi:hypothetical protein
MAMPTPKSDGAPKRRGRLEFLLSRRGFTAAAAASVLFAGSGIKAYSRDWAPERQARLLLR